MTTTTRTAGATSISVEPASSATAAARLHRPQVVTLLMLAAALAVGAVLGAVGGMWWQSRTSAPASSSAPGAAVLRTHGLDAEALAYAGRRVAGPGPALPAPAVSRPAADPETRRYGSSAYLGSAPAPASASVPGARVRAVPDYETRRYGSSAYRAAPPARTAVDAQARAISLAERGRRSGS